MNFNQIVCRFVSPLCITACVRVCVCVRASAWVCVCVQVCERMSVCLRACMHGCAFVSVSERYSPLFLTEPNVFCICELFASMPKLI